MLEIAAALAKFRCQASATPRIQQPWRAGRARCEGSALPARL